VRILIAEDDPTSRDFLFRFIKRYGECDMVVDGFEALDAYLLSVKEKKPYDLLCIDIMMPKFDGIKVLKAIRNIEAQMRIGTERRTKIILTTALDKSYIEHNSFEFEYDAFISKPIDLSKLIRVLHDMKLIEIDMRGD